MSSATMFQWSVGASTCCTCCITWSPCCPVFCWIEHSRHYRAVVGYVTSWTHAFLSVRCGVSWGTTGAALKLRSARSSLLPPRSCNPVPHLIHPNPLNSSFSLLLSLSLSGKMTLLVTLWPRCTVLLMPLCLVRMMCSGLFQQQFTAHPAAATSVYIMSHYVFFLLI